MRKQRENLSGQKFGRLSVLKTLTVYGKYLCLCDCGKEAVALQYKLTKGRTKSCGCLRKELYDRKDTGITHVVEYNSYNSAKSRCNNPHDVKYFDYGGRGIEFKFPSFSQFMEELGYKPSSKHSLDRINNDGHYEPGNVKWSTSKEQANNKRKRSKDRVNHELLVAYAKSVMGEYGVST